MKNPIEDKKSPYRVARGGYWDSSPEGVRSSRRRDDDPADRGYDIGFRLVKNIPKDKK